MKAATTDALRLAVERIFGEVDDTFMGQVEAAVRTIRIGRGERLYRQGEVGDGMHILLSGRLQIRVADADGAADRVVGVLGPGDVVGEIALFTGGSRGATVVATRDSTLAFLSQDSFEAASHRHPDISNRLAGFIIHRLVSAQQGRASRDEKMRLIAVVPLDDELDAYSFASKLQLALLRFGTTALVDPRTTRTRLGPDLGISADGSALELEQHLDEVEASERFAILEGDLGSPEWTRKCITYADRILFLARADADVETAAVCVETLLPGGDAPMPRSDLVLLHPDAGTRPSRTSRWLNRLPVQGHHHVVEGSEVGFSRLARFMSGNAVGLVLAGGGARGMAHIGVIRALREAGVPVDVVGGTSIGAIVAGGLAAGWDNRRMLNEYRQAFVDERPTSDYTLPVMGLLRGRRMERGLRRRFGAAEVPDLWLPYFALSSSITRNREFVHREGLVWRVQRASASLPGIFPPWIEDGELLIDGGILNNLPVDVMRRSFDGHVIAVDLTAEEDVIYEDEALPSAWEYIRNYQLYQDDEHPAPTVHRVLLKATMLSSRRELESARSQADLYLNPPVGSFDLLDWNRFDELVEIGYRYGREMIEGWVRDHPELMHHAAVTDVRLRRASA